MTEWSPKYDRLTYKNLAWMIFIPLLNVAFLASCREEKTSSGSSGHTSPHANKNQASTTTLSATSNNENNVSQKSEKSKKSTQSASINELTRSTGIYFPSAQEKTEKAYCEVIKKVKSTKSEPGLQFGLFVDPHVESKPEALYAGYFSMPNSNTAPTLCDALVYASTHGAFLNLGSGDSSMNIQPFPDPCDANVFIRGLFGINMQNDAWWGVAFAADGQMDWMASMGVGVDKLEDGMLVGFNYSTTHEEKKEGTSIFVPDSPLRVTIDDCK